MRRVAFFEQAIDAFQNHEIFRLRKVQGGSVVDDDFLAVRDFAVGEVERELV